MKKKITGMFVFVLLIATVLPFTGIVSSRNEENPEIEDKPGDTRDYVDILSAWFYEDSKDSDYFWTIVELADLKSRPHTYYYVSWMYNDTRYQTIAMNTLSGHSFSGNWNFSWNSLDGEFDYENNVIKVKVPKREIGNPQNGEKLTYTSAYSMVEGFRGLPLFSDYAPDCGYGMDYIIGGGNVERQPGIQLVHCEFYLCPYTSEDVESFNFSYVIPLNYFNQAPILCNVKNDSTLQPLSYEIVNDTNAPNKLIQFKFQSLKANDELRNIQFDFWIFVKNDYFKDLPQYVKIPYENELPEYTKTWLISTQAIQSENFLIKTTAKKIKGSTENLITLADKIVKFTPLRWRAGWVFQSQDALFTLLFGGICIGQANLATALFRANGIPAKDIYVIPTGGQVKHANCEYYCPGYGWVPTNPTTGRTPYEPKSAITLRVNYPEDENEAGCFFKKNRGQERDYWFSEGCIDLEYTSTNDSRVQAQIVASLDSTEKDKLNALNITKKVWEHYTKYFGHTLNEEKQEHFENAVNAQVMAIECFMQEDITGYMNNMTIAIDEYREIVDS